MNNYKVLFLSVMVIIVLITSGCAKETEYNMTFFVDNQTNNDYLVYADSYSDTVIISVKANAKDFLIKKFPGFMPTYHFDIAEHYNIYIYNTLDSTYARFEDHSLYKQDNIRRIDGRIFVKPSHSFTKNDKNKEVCEYVNIYIINDSLVKLMCKNTHLTDSVFKLKK